MTRPSFTLALLAGGTLAAALALYQPGIRVVDGDTVDHAFWRWRLAGLDAPETFRARCPEERALGERATARLRGLLAASGGGWRLIPVATRRDAYGRRLGRLEASGEDVAAVLIREGLARPYDGGRRRPWCP